MPNLFSEFKKLLPNDPLMVGTVLSVGGGQVNVELPEGRVVVARGTGSVGSKVYVQGGFVQGAAPSLPMDTVVV